MELNDDIVVVSAAPSSSTLSDAPTTSHPDSDKVDLKSSDGTGEDLPATNHGRETPATGAVPTTGGPSTPSAIPPGLDATTNSKLQILSTMSQLRTPQQDAEMPSKRASKGGRAKNLPLSRSAGSSRETSSTKLEHESPGSASQGRGRGRGGRPRGRARGATRAGKRKHEDAEDDESDSSEIVTPITTTTKSGRSIQKPTSFVPPPAQSPTAKRKRPYRRNPENAVCKICLRGSSPAGNMIVFCDGCNTPYHRYCHKPPIDQVVVDEVDKAWHCRHCEAEYRAPVPEADIASYVSVDGATAEERKRYFSSLPPGMLITLLTKASTLKPDLPLFSTEFRARIAANPRKSSAKTTLSTDASRKMHEQGSSSHLGAPSQTLDAQSPSVEAKVTADAEGVQVSIEDQEEMLDEYEVDDDHEPGYPPDQHPSHYPRPGRGLMQTLPPDSQKPHWLVDEDDAKDGVFTHLYQVPNDGMAVATPPVKG